MSRFVSSVALFWALASCFVCARPSQGEAKFIAIASGCEGDKEVSVRVFPDSLVWMQVHGEDSLGSGQVTDKRRVLSGNSRLVADSLFALLNGLGGAMILRCPNTEAVSCRFEAGILHSRLTCTNCSACSEDLDRMSLATLRRVKDLLRQLNLFL